MIRDTLRRQLRRFLAEHPKYYQGLAGYAQCFASGVTRFQNGMRFALFTLLGGIIFAIISLMTRVGEGQGSDFSFYRILLTVGLRFLFIKITYSVLLRFLYAATKTPLEPGGFGLVSTVFLWILVSGAGYFAFDPSMVPSIADTISQHLSQTELAVAIEKETLAVILHWVAVWFFYYWVAVWFFYYFLHVYIFSFFNRCMEKKNSQPVSKSWVGNTIFVGLLVAAGGGWFEIPSTIKEIILHPFTMSCLFWGFTASVAYLHLRKEMGEFSKADIADYWQRNSLLRQYRNTDFEKPLLLTDWYPKALDLARRPQPTQQKPPVFQTPPPPKPPVFQAKIHP